MHTWTLAILTLYVLIKLLTNGIHKSETTLKRGASQNLGVCRGSIPCVSCYYKMLTCELVWGHAQNSAPRKRTECIDPLCSRSVSQLVGGMLKHSLDHGDRRSESDCVNSQFIFKRTITLVCTQWQVCLTYKEGNGFVISQYKGIVYKYKNISTQYLFLCELSL